MYRSRLAFALAMAALAAILVPSALTAQITFERTYGGPEKDASYAAQQTSDGGYAIVGYTRSEAVQKDLVYLVKTDPDGDTVWTRTFGGTDGGYGYWIQQTSDRGYIIAGITHWPGSGDQDVYLVKTDSLGDTMWTRTYGGPGSDQAYSVSQTADGGYIAVGSTDDYGAGDLDVYLIKTDVHGDTLWTRTYGGLELDEGYSVQQTPDSGYIITGYTSSFGAGNNDVYLIKTDARGIAKWTKTYGGAMTDIGNSVQLTADGGYIIAGVYSDSDYDVWVIKTDANGDTLWTRAYSGEGSGIGTSIRPTTDGGYVVAGYTCFPHKQFEDVYLIKTNANGDSLWTRTYGDTLRDQASDVWQTTDGGYAVTGPDWDWGPGGREDFYLIKTDSLGNVAVAEPKTSPTRAPALSLTCEPNPSSGTTRISFKPQASSSKPLTLRVFDASGNLVWSQPVRASSFIFHPSSLPSGAYFLRLDAAGRHATTRLVITR